MRNQSLHFIFATAFVAVSLVSNAQATVKPVVLNCDMLVSGSAAITKAATGECAAFIDNKCFELNEQKPITAVVIEPTSLQEGAAAKTMINIALSGKSDAKSEDESIQFSLALTEPLSPGSAGAHVTLNHKGIVYTLVKGDGSDVEITDFIWSKDRKSFMLSLSFNCKMRNPAFLATGGKDLNLKGKLLRIKVMVPGATSASN